MYKRQACVLPLADDKDIAKELGTRHRAAIGISKESDSIVAVSYTHLSPGFRPAFSAAEKSSIDFT